jgi:hypothetical protein
MSVLLRQPHGFEGIGLAHAGLPVNDYPGPKRIDPRVLPEGHLDTRRAPAHPLVDQRHYTVPRV